MGYHKIMENFEPKPEQKFLFRPRVEIVYFKQIEEIALRAAEMKEFQDVVKQAKSKLDAVRVVRELLPQHFPEIDELPKPEVKSAGILSPASNEFMVAKNIVDLLYEK